MKRLHGNVITVVISILEKMHLKSVHYVITHKHTSENKILVTSRFFFSFFFFFVTFILLNYIISIKKGYYDRKQHLSFNR